MKRFVKFFARDESGAVTVDWVVLTALVVTLLGAGYGSLESATQNVTDDTSSYMQNWTF
jgi:Flp pilus assembly pilin Flp